tara:strand:+ start:1301 stop:2785 length:1485 start_codon:yes stop_codon:yes gene_type:complete
MRLNFDDFKTLALKYKVVPVFQAVLADLITPIGAYLRFQAEESHCFLLESVVRGTRARYSFLGRNPQKIFSYSKGVTTIQTDGEVSQRLDINFLNLLREEQANFKVAPLEGFPSFTGGLVGYLGYETVQFFEKIPVHEHSYEEGEEVPDSIFMLMQDLMVFDHNKNQVIVFTNTHIESHDELYLREQYEKSHARIDEFGMSLHSQIEYQLPPKSQRSQMHSNMTQRQFEKSVCEAKKAIVDGELFQIVLSQRFHRKTQAEGCNIYRALRSINPSPYMFHMKFSDFELIGASPEVLVKVEDREMEVRPIAGTRERGKTEFDDRQLAQDLLQDDKECAEHLMLVDLGRNDVGRVAEYGSVRIPEYMEIEKYSHVMHIVSQVKGTLREEYDAWDALYSAFPAGTTSGAPKIRAMEWINRLENCRRGIYSGAVGYLDGRNELNTCIAIRTLWKKGENVYFQAGAGIVYDSDPAKEFDETVNKAKAIMRAIDLAEDGLL